MWFITQIRKIGKGNFSFCEYTSRAIESTQQGPEQPNSSAQRLQSMEAHDVIYTVVSMQPKIRACAQAACAPLNILVFTESQCSF